jgi:uncharacterized repeat protein (TIGR01451 family)
LSLVAALASGLSATVVEAQLQINEGFATVPPPGWVVINHSQPLGPFDWFQGNGAVFPAQSGAANSYAGANFESTAGTGTISDWLLTPPVNLANGTVLTFYTRKVSPDEYPDRMQVRLSTSGVLTDVGATATDVGVFTTLLLDINPTLVIGGYPIAWTQYTATLSGLPAGNTLGRVAFRYFVTNGGPTGANSDYIGVDTVTLTDVVADLSITKTDGQTVAVPGTPVTYTIVASNAGPNTATGATVADTVPAAITGATWTCAGAGSGICTAAGSGNINDAVTLPVGGTVTYTLTGTINVLARGSLGNTATVAPPVGVTDSNPANDSATDTDILPGVSFFTVAPCRVVDTRGGAPIGGPVLQGQQTRVFAMAGNCGIPSTANALSVNLTATQSTAPGNVRLFPAGQPVPPISSINYVAGQTRANNAIVSLDFSGQMAAFVGQPVGTTVHLIIDVNGYFE